MEVISYWLCPTCEASWSSEDGAYTCCPLPILEMLHYCGKCNARWADKDRAENCCKEEEQE